MDIKRFKAWAESKKLSTDGETGRNYSYTFYDSKTQAAWGAWQAAKAQAVPEGFVLVPEQPTPKMIDATWNFDEEIQDMSHNSRNEFIYNAMIAAAQEQGQ